MGNFHTFLGLVNVAEASILNVVLQVGATGKALTNVVSVGIGGSFLGPLFVHTALQTGKLLGSSVLGFLETSMYFELTCPEKIANFQIQKQQNVQKAGS